MNYKIYIQFFLTLFLLLNIVDSKMYKKSFSLNRIATSEWIFLTKFGVFYLGKFKVFFFPTYIQYNMPAGTSEIRAKFNKPLEE